MKYKVVCVTAAFSTKKALLKLTDEVNSAISMGWEPIGGICLEGTSILQAMVRKR